MRLKVMTVTSVMALGLVSAGYAAEINQSGANDIRKGMTEFLPKEAARKGFITVKPAGTRYEIIYDFGRLLEKNKFAGLVVNGLLPQSFFATPQDDGLWHIEGNNSLNVSGSFKPKGQPKSEFTYLIDSLIIDGIFDPAISYLRSADMSSKGISFSSKTNNERVTASLGPMKYRLSSQESAAAGRVNFATSGTAEAFVETVSSNDIPPVEFRADTLEVAAVVNGLAARDLRDIVIFAAQQPDGQKLGRAESEKLKGMLRNSFPLLTSFNETVTLGNLSISSSGGNGGAKSFDYSIAMDGASDAMQFGIGMKATDISFGSPLVPAAYSAFVPSSMQLQFSMPGMNFAAFGEELLNVNFTDADAANENGEKIFEKLFNNGDVVFDFPKITAVSSTYDVDISGTMRGRYGATNEYSMNASVLVRDLDKTIAAVQELAKTNPELTQVSFGMMMAKGFAKAEPDGRQRWDVNVARDGAVTINGQIVKGAN